MISRLGARLRRASPLWVAVGTIGASGFSFLFQGYLSLILSDSAFGAISSAIVVAVALGFLAALGAQNVMLDFIKRRAMDSQIVLLKFMHIWIFTYFAAFGGGIIVLFAYRAGFEKYVFISTLALLLSLFTILGSNRQSRDDFRGVCVYLIAPEFAKLVAVGIAYLYGAHEIDTAFMTLGMVFLAIVTFGLFAPSFWRGWTLAPSYRQIFLVGLPYAVSALLFMIYYRSTLVIFASHGKLEEAGSLAIIYLFMTAILLVPTSYSQRYLLGRWHAVPRHQRGLFTSELRRQLRSILIFSVPIAIGWLLFSQPVLNFVYDERYPLARAHAHWFAIIFLIRSVCIPLQAATSLDEMKWRKTWVVLAAALTTVALSLALVRPLGLIGALVSGIAAESVLVLGLTLLVRQHLRTAPGLRG